MDESRLAPSQRDLLHAVHEVKNLVEQALNRLVALTSDTDEVKRGQLRHSVLLQNLKTQGERLMAVADDIKNLLKELDGATNAVAANIAVLSGKIKNSMTDAEVADIKAGFAAESARLGDLAKDPTNPVPTP